MPEKRPCRVCGVEVLWVEVEGLPLRLDNVKLSVEAANDLDRRGVIVVECWKLRLKDAYEWVLWWAVSELNRPGYEPFLLPHHGCDRREEKK